MGAESPPSSVSQRKKALLSKLSVEGPSSSLTSHFPGTWASCFFGDTELPVRCRQ